MKIGANVTLRAAAFAVERKLLAAAERKDAESMDHLLDLLRALSDVEELDIEEAEQPLRLRAERVARAT
jgi:hypothetical protein